MNQGSDRGPEWRVNDEVWQRQGPFLRKKRITKVAGEAVYVDGRLTPRSSLGPASSISTPDTVRGLALEVEVYDYRVWRAYETDRLSGLGRRQKVVGLYVEYSGCQGVSSRYFAGHGSERRDVLELLSGLESGRST